MESLNPSPESRHGPGVFRFFPQCRRQAVSDWRLDGEARLRLSPVPELPPLDCQLDRAQYIQCWYRDSGRTVSTLTHLQ